jgi:hypothetical protein
MNLTSTLNKFQASALQKPHAMENNLLLRIISFIESLMTIKPTYMDSKRQVLGDNFCCAGQVVLGEFGAIESALTSPQARTFRLGSVFLDSHNLPNQDAQGRNVFLLALSDRAAGGNGDHELFRTCLENYVLNSETIARQQDETAKGLLRQLGADYAEMPHGLSGAFFETDQRGWKGFLVKYLHYVLFGISPDNAKAIDLLTELHYTRSGTFHYFTGIGSTFAALNIKKHKDLNKLIEEAATIYENSPALANFQQENNGMTRRELAKMLTAIVSIAALQGPKHLGETALGYKPLPAYQGRQTAQIDLMVRWDGLDLSDSPTERLHQRESVKLYLLECARLSPPVTGTHRIATEPFTANIAGAERTFPAGTQVLIPLSLGMLDEGFWGATAYDFDAQRENLCPYHMGFHGVGERSAGRICPGKDLALEMLIDVMIAVGHVRRSA